MCVHGADLLRSVEFRELLVQVEFGHLAVEDPQRTICKSVSLHVCVCTSVCLSVCTPVLVCVKIRLS